MMFAECNARLLFWLQIGEFWLSTVKLGTRCEILHLQLPENRFLSCAVNLSLETLHPDKRGDKHTRALHQFAC